MQYQYVQKWSRPKFYFGPDWLEYYGCPGLGIHRDSNQVDRSNFRVAVRRLGGESDTVKVLRDAHWAVGWVENLLVHESDEKALSQLDELGKFLANAGPVAISDSDLEDLEREDGYSEWEELFGKS